MIPTLPWRRTALAVCLPLLMALPDVGGAAPVPRPALAEAQLRAINHRFVNAYAQPDLAFMEALTADDFLMIGSNGDWVDRVGHLDALRRSAAVGRVAYDDVRAILALSEHTASLDAPLDIDPSLSIGESLADEHAETPDVQIHTAEIEDLIRTWINMLNDKQRLVIRHRYGLDECEMMTLEELASRLELTRERVRQIQLEALSQLRRILKRRGISKDVLL